MEAFQSKYVIACLFVWFAVTDFCIAKEIHSKQMPYPKLPLVNTILLKYGFAKFWNIQIQPSSLAKDHYCSSEEQTTITNCGIQPFVDILFGDRPLNNSRKLKQVDFNTELKTTCSNYASFKNCVRKHHVDQCLAIDKAIVDIAYSYLCGSGRQALEEDYTGQCLSTLSEATVVEVMKSQIGCQKGLGNLQSILEIMLSMYHDHDDRPGQKEITVIKPILFTLCRSWHSVETCSFPAYRKLCGQKAMSFYVGLLQLVKTDLENQFVPFGSELATLARCSENTQLVILKENVKISDQVEFVTYLKKQLFTWTLTADLTKQIKGPCAPVTTTLILTKCFWQALVDSGPGLAKLLKLTPKLFNQLLMSFGECYIEAVGSCSNKEKIDFSDLIKASIYITSKSDQLVTCLDVMSMLNVSEATCGIRFWDLLNQYIFKGTLIYISAMKSCSHSLPFLSFPEIHCLADASKKASQNATLSHQSSPCAKRFFPYIIRFLKGLESVTEQAIAVFEEVFKGFCPN